MTAPPEESDVNLLLESNEDDLIELRETYGATTTYVTPSIVDAVGISDPVSVSADESALALFSDVRAEDALRDGLETWVLLSDFELVDVRFGYVVEIDTQQGFEERPDLDEDSPRVVGGIAPFPMSEDTMGSMDVASVPENQQFGPAVLTATSQLRRLAGEDPEGELAVRVTQFPLGGAEIDGQTTELGAIRLALVNT